MSVEYPARPASDTAASSARKHKSRLAITLALTGVFLIAEVVAGVATRSLALLADAGHMLTDVAGLALALIAIHFAQRAPTPQRSYGFYRVEILAALSNAVVLIAISVFVLFEAYERFRNPPPIPGGAVMLVAALGLVVNLVGILLLRAGADQSLNLKGAYFEVLSDLLTSVGVLIAGLIIWTTNWYYADPLISAAIGLLILPRTWLLLRDAVGILLEGSPADIDLDMLRVELGKFPGVVDVHDLHVWTLTSGMNAMSVHIVATNEVSRDSVLTDVHRNIKAAFNISHLTVQVEPIGWERSETHL